MNVRLGFPLDHKDPHYVLLKWVTTTSHYLAGGKRGSIPTQTGTEYAFELANHKKGFGYEFTRFPAYGSNYAMPENLQYTGTSDGACAALVLAAGVRHYHEQSPIVLVSCSIEQTEEHKGFHGLKLARVTDASHSQQKNIESLCNKWAAAKKACFDIGGVLVLHYQDTKLLTDKNPNINVISCNELKELVQNPSNFKNKDPFLVSVLMGDMPTLADSLGISSHLFDKLEEVNSFELVAQVKQLEKKIDELQVEKSNKIVSFIIIFLFIFVLWFGSQKISPIEKKILYLQKKYNLADKERQTTPQVTQMEKRVKIIENQLSKKKKLTNKTHKTLQQLGNQISKHNNLYEEIANRVISLDTQLSSKLNRDNFISWKDSETRHLFQILVDSQKGKRTNSQTFSRAHQRDVIFEPKFEKSILLLEISFHSHIEISFEKKKKRGYNTSADYMIFERNKSQKEVSISRSHSVGIKHTGIEGGILIPVTIKVVAKNDSTAKRSFFLGHANIKAKNAPSFYVHTKHIVTKIIEIKQ